MAAPSNTVWGSIVKNKNKDTSQGRIGISVALENSNDTTNVHIEVWFWSRYSVIDSSNTIYFNNNASTATNNVGSANISHSVATGSGWDTSNQTLIYQYDTGYKRASTDKTLYCAAKFAGVDAVSNITMTVSTSYVIPAYAIYTVTYDANGGSGAPTSQTKFYGVDLTLSTTVPTRSGYKFDGWRTTKDTASALYLPGSTYSDNESITLYAAWSNDEYTITYNGNGATTGIPAKQTKTHGVNITLSSATPTRSGYTFVGWGLSSTSTTVSYSPGSTYSKDASITLYAIWTTAYTPPRINNIKMYRCDAEGIETGAGVYFKLSFSWETDKAVTAINIRWRKAGLSYWAVSQGVSVTSGATSGLVEVVRGGDVAADYEYEVQIEIIDSDGSNELIKTLPLAYTYTIDFLKGGKGVAIGTQAEREDTFDIGLKRTVVGGYLVVNGGSDPVDTLTSGGIGIFTNGRISSTHGIEASSFENRIDSTEDIPSTWADYNVQVFPYTSSVLANQPTAQGLLCSYGLEDDVAFSKRQVCQLWMPSTGYGLYYRYGIAGPDADAWVSGGWKELVFGDKVVNTSAVYLGNTVNVIGQLRQHTSWLGFYNTTSDAQNNTDRYGWIGYSGSTNFQVTNTKGTANVTNYAWTTSSDERLKDNVTSIPDVLLDIWTELQPKVFTWKDVNAVDNRMHFGLIAQDVIRAFEKYNLDYRDYGFVNTFTLGDTEYFGISYDEYHMLTSAVLKETNAKVADMQKQIDDLRELIFKMEK